MSKPKKEKPKVFTLYLTYDQISNGGEALESGPWASHAPTYLTTIFRGLHRSAPKQFFRESIEVPEEIFNASVLYVAVVKFSDGDTFGTTYGKFEIIGCYKNLGDAEIGAKLGVANGLSLYPGYKPWEGYFSSFEGTNIEVLHVSD